MVRSIALLNGGTTHVDDADYDAVCHLPWRRSSKGYIMYSFTENGQRHEVYLHRLLMRARRGEVVDHRDNDKANNCRANLRCCTVQENLRNRRRFSNNDCGFKGVTAWRGHWLARIYVNDHAVRLGIYDDLKTAAQAYDVAARLLFHGFAAFNLPDSPASPACRTKSSPSSVTTSATMSSSCCAAPPNGRPATSGGARIEVESEMVWSALDIPVDLYGAVFA